MLTEKPTIRGLRRAKDISQQAMADKVGIHINTYRRLEKNPENASAKHVAVVAKLLGVTIEELF